MWMIINDVSYECSLWKMIATAHQKHTHDWVLTQTSSNGCDDIGSLLFSCFLYIDKQHCQNTARRVGEMIFKTTNESREARPTQLRTSPRHVLTQHSTVFITYTEVLNCHMPIIVQQTEYITQFSSKNSFKYIRITTARRQTNNEQIQKENLETITTWKHLQG